MLIKSNGKALHRPVLSPDGRTLAVIAPDEKIHLIDLHEAARGGKFINGLRITRSERSFLRTCGILRWSPEVFYPPDDAALETASQTTSECDFGKSWLLLSDGVRVIALSTELRNPRMMPTADDETGAKSNVLADYHLGGEMGRINLLEFVFDHRHALVVSEFGAAAMLTLARPHRHDIPHLKFPDGRGFARAPDSRYFALLRRDKGQEKVTVFRLGDNNQIMSKSFDCKISDAQSVHWCPTGQSLLAVRDSAAHGVNVRFFTPEGHALTQFDISRSVFQWSPTTADSSQPEGLGLSYWQWRKGQSNNDATVQILVNGGKQVLVRYQPMANSMEARGRARIPHPESFDGSKTLIWIESGRTTADNPVDFSRQTGAYDVDQTAAPQEPKQRTKPESQHQAEDPLRVDMVELNCTHTALVTRLNSSPRTLFLWRSPNSDHPHSMVVFKHSIRQVCYHPRLPDVLAVITSSKNPRLYVCWQPDSPPIAGLIPIEVTPSTHFRGAWLSECVVDSEFKASGGATSGNSQRCPFLFTSNTAFEAGYLSSKEGKVRFESILHRPEQPEEDLTFGTDGEESIAEPVETPSKPSKQGTEAIGGGVVKKARFDVPEDDETDSQEDPIHGEAKVKFGFVW